MYCKTKSQLTKRALDAKDCRPALAGTACGAYDEHFAQRGFEFSLLPNRIHIHPSASNAAHR